MESYQYSSFGLFLLTHFSRYLTAPSMQNLLTISHGWALSTSRHTITTYLLLSGAVTYKHFSRYYYFLSGPFLSAQEHLWMTIIRIAVQFVGPDEPIRLIIDDSTKKKSGRTIEGRGRYRNGAGTARQEYRSIWGLNFVVAVMQVKSRHWPDHCLSLPIGVKVYMKQAVAHQLGIPHRSRSGLARELLDLVVRTHPDRAIRVLADGGYASKEFLRELPGSVQVVSRFPIDSKLYALPGAVPQGRRGRKPLKGALIGSAVSLQDSTGCWEPHPREPQAYIGSWEGLWHSVLPRVTIRIIVLKRPESNTPRRRPLEAFFTTDLSLGVTEILQEYHRRWAIEIDLRDGYEFYGLGGDYCRSYQRILGVNNFRLLMAAARTLWYLDRVNRQKQPDLQRLRPWYTQKRHASQQDIMWACREVLESEGISPTCRFIQDVGLNSTSSDYIQDLAA